MMHSHILFVIGAGILVVSSSKLHSADPGDTCKPLDGLVKYNLTFEGHWSKKVFPKQYPLFRPNAQWSKLIGRSHSNEYTLFSIGSTASKSLKELSQLGTTSEYDRWEQQGRQGILDLFYTAPIEEGVGAEWTTFFADQNHHLLSFASKIIPSPDWFVGSNSISLCSGNEWVTEREVDLFPIDAGTDKGFTFTSPNWAENPLRPITQITSTFPSHEANSFYNKTWSHIPVMAKVKIQIMEVFKKVDDMKEEVQHPDEGGMHDSQATENESKDDEDVKDSSIEKKEGPKPEMMSAEPEETVEEQRSTLGGDTPDISTEGTAVTESIDHGSKAMSTKAEKKTTDIKTTNKGFDVTKEGPGTSKLLARHTVQSAATKYHTSPTAKDSAVMTETNEVLDDQAITTVELEISSKPTPVISSTITTTEIPLNDFIHQQNIPTKREQRQRRKKKRNQRRNGKRERKHGQDKPTKDEKAKPEKVKCILGEWAEWSSCSVSCGYGKRNRARVVIQQPKHGGAPCRQYPEEDLCGTLRTCSQWKHFSFADWGIHLK